MLCYEFPITFGEEDCRHISPSVFQEYFRGKRCKDFICTSFFDPLEAYICIEKKEHEYKLMIFGRQENLTFDVYTFKENDGYTIERMAISGTHFSVLLYSDGDAYRQSFDYKNLTRHITNKISTNHVGSVNIIKWAPTNDCDYYFENDFQNVTQYLHNNTKMEKANTASLENRCTKWNNSIIHIPATTTTKFVEAIMSAIPLTSTYVSPSTTVIKSKYSNFSGEIAVAFFLGITFAIAITFIYCNCCKEIPNNNGQNLGTVQFVATRTTGLQPPSYRSQDGVTRTNENSSQTNTNLIPEVSEEIQLLQSENPDDSLGAVHIGSCSVLPSSVH